MALNFYTDSEKNSRNWQSFFSRSNSNLNLPYYYFTLKSIISKNNDDFNICIIDDSALTKLLEREEYEYNLEQISDPKTIVTHIRFRHHPQHVLRLKGGL